MQLFISTSFSLCLLLLLLSTCAFSAEPSSTETADIYCWPLSSAKPVMLGRLEYDPATFESSFASYQAPSSVPSSASSSSPLSSSSEKDDLARVGFFVGSQWVGSLTSLSSLAVARSDNSVSFRVQFDPTSRKPYDISLGKGDVVAPPSISEETPFVETVPIRRGAVPFLAEPVDHSKQTTEKGEEKTFLQK